MRVRAFLFAILLCLTSSCMFGQAAAAGSEAAASPDDIRKLFDVMQIRNQMKLVMQQISQQIRSLERDQVRKQQPNVTDQDFAKFDAISDEVMKNLSVEGLLDDMIPVYQKHLNKSDVNAMVGFYSTPTGQKILREMPAMTTEGMQAMQPHLKQMIEEANAELEKRVKEEMQQKKQGDAAKPNTVKN
ncbi:MAG: DUF2059 domain-containing protein [Acidobacteriia bacterium]|nr:DUF2059 domain-containing protein [Terriglobia bacterium]